MMRRYCLALLAAGCSGTALAAPSVDWKISEASGSVQLLHQGVSRVAARKDVVSAGDTITTGKDGRAVLVRGTEFVMVAPGSQLRVPAAAAEATGVTRLLQEFGNAVFMIKKKLSPHFEVKTPYLAAVVKGTTFTVTVNAEGASVQVLEGAVDVATNDGGAHDLILPGSVALVATHDLYRMHIDGAAGRRVIESTTAPTSPAEAPVSASGPANIAAAPAVPEAQSMTIAVPVHAEAVSLAEVTSGLISGTNGRDTSEIAAVSRTTAEASRSVVRAIEIASAARDAQAVEAIASARAAQQASDALTESARAAQAAENAQADLLAAQAQKARDDAARKAAQDAAALAADAAAAAAAQTAQAEVERLAGIEASKQADAAATLAAQNAAAAAKAAADELAAAQAIVDEQARDAARAAADQAAQMAAKAQADAEQARLLAQKAADDAARADADKAVREAENAARAAAAERAANEARLAAEAAQDAAAKQAAKEAEAAAKEAERLAAQSAAEQAQANAAQGTTGSSSSGNWWDKWKEIIDTLKDRFDNYSKGDGNSQGFGGRY